MININFPTQQALQQLCLILLIFCTACVSPGKRTKSALVSDVNTVATMADIEPVITRAGADTLILLDVDDTLIMPTDEFSFTHSVRKRWVQRSKSMFSKEHRDVLISKIWKNRKVRFVENKVLSILEMIKKKKIPTYALTAMYTGQFGDISHVENWRISELLSMGIDFSKLSSFATLSFPALKTERGIPMLKAGVIFTALRDKAEVFSAVFKSLVQKPKTIIFVDDDPNYVHSMQKLCTELGLNFYGFIYTAAKNVSTPSLDERIEEKRFDYLEKHGEWITDDSFFK